MLVKKVSFDNNFGKWRSNFNNSFIDEFRSMNCIGKMAFTHITPLPPQSVAALPVQSGIQLYNFPIIIAKTICIMSGFCLIVLLFLIFLYAVYGHVTGTLG